VTDDRSHADEEAIMRLGSQIQGLIYRGPDVSHAARMSALTGCMAWLLTRIACPSCRQEIFDGVVRGLPSVLAWAMADAAELHKDVPPHGPSPRQHH
jgi:hypothetical protein